MADIQWTEDMSVGVDSIDTDHRLLLGLVNQLSDAIKVGQGGDAISSILDALLDYTSYHFGREEMLMRACGYPDVDTHAHTHQLLQGQVTRIRDRFVANPETIHYHEVLAFLTNWLIAHIMGRDKLYAPFMASRAAEVERAERAYSERQAKDPRRVEADDAGHQGRRSGP